MELAEHDKNLATGAGREVMVGSERCEAMIARFPWTGMAFLFAGKGGSSFFS